MTYMVCIGSICNLILKRRTKNCVHWWLRRKKKFQNTYVCIIFSWLGKQSHVPYYNNPSAWNLSEWTNFTGCVTHSIKRDCDAVTWHMKVSSSFVCHSKFNIQTASVIPKNGTRIKWRKSNNLICWFANELQISLCLGSVWWDTSPLPLQQYHSHKFLH